MIDLRKVLNDRDGRFRVGKVVDAAVVERVWNERLVELTVPQLQQRCRHVRVAADVVWRPPSVAVYLQGVYFVYVSWHPESRQNSISTDTSYSSMSVLKVRFGSMGLHLNPLYKGSCQEGESLA